MKATRPVPLGSSVGLAMVLLLMSVSVIGLMTWLSGIN